MAEFPDEKKQRRLCFTEGVSWKTESGELELMDSKMHIIQLSINYSLELGGFFLSFARVIFSQKKYLSTKGNTYYHMSLWELPPRLTKVLSFH